MTSSSSAPQPPMELLATGPLGAANFVSHDSLSPPVGAGFTTPFAVDSRSATVYYVESDELKAATLRNPNSARVSRCYPINSYLKLKKYLYR